jgi:hypothetical protein
MLMQTHFTDFNIRAFKGLWKSLRGITKDYQRLTMVHEEVRRYTITTFTIETKKPKERQPQEAKLFIFPHNIKFGPSFKRKHSQVRVKYW